MRRFFHCAVSFVMTISFVIVFAACGAGTREDDANIGQSSEHAEKSEVYENDIPEVGGIHEDEKSLAATSALDVKTIEAAKDFIGVSGAHGSAVLQEAGELPGEFPMTFLFSSGAGGWATELVLEADVTFHGTHYDSDMGIRDELEYPNGTLYICNFSGIFENITQVNDYTWTMNLADIEQNETRDEIWIEDGIRYIGSYPYGLEEGEGGFTFYTPDAPISVLSQEDYFWYPYRWSQVSDTLDCYCIHNDATGESFFSELVNQ